MDKTTGTSAGTPIIENQHVQELLSILKDNNKDAGSLISLFGYISNMENQLAKAVEELTSVRQELGTMREERDHPVRTALEKTARSLETAINETRQKLNELKEKVVEGCKNAVQSFKANGISALNGIASFFRLKPALESLRGSIDKSIASNQASIAKIDAVSAEYHSAGRHIKNIGRTIIGKEPLTEVKPKGKLAKLMQTPYRTEIKCLEDAKKNVDKAIAAFERLDKAAPKKEASAKRGKGKSEKEEKPSTLETMKVLQKQIEAEKQIVPDKSKKISAEL